MPLYDVYCKKCNSVEEDVWLSVDELPEICRNCGDARHVIPGGRFKLVYNNKTDTCDWSGNSSQYWKDVRAANERGEKVKGCNE